MASRADPLIDTKVDTTASDLDSASAFDCNICLSQAKDPVVTVCGHLYCWPCLYRWLETPSSSHNCPVCNAGVEKSKVIPLYGRGCEQTDPRKKEVVIPQDLIVPRRPTAQRPHSMQRSRGLYGLHNMNPLSAFLSGSHSHGSDIPFSYHVTPDQQNMVFAQRLMLLGGSFIILFLLLF